MTVGVLDATIGEIAVKVGDSPRGDFFLDAVWPIWSISDARISEYLLAIIRDMREQMMKETDEGIISCLQQDLMEAEYKGEKISNQKAIYMFLEAIDSDNITVRVTEKGQKILAEKKFGF